MENPKVLAIIPARGGSKRFPRKNIFPLNGKPLISYPINAAKKSAMVQRVVVSTDDEEIAKVARESGAEVPFMRPVELAGDKSPVIDAVIHMVKKLEEQEGYVPGYILLLQPATPLVTAEQIDSAVKLVLEKNADSIISVSQVNTPNHPFNIREIREDGTIKFWQEDIHYEYYLDQKPKPKFYYAANLWLTSYKTLIEEKRFEGKKNYPLIVDSIHALDIDYPEDLELIETWIRYKNL